MRRTGCWWAGLLGAVLALAGCGVNSSTEATSQPPPSTVQPPASPPTDEKSESEENEILSVLSVEREVDLLAQVDGIVVEIVRDEGAQVQAEAVLARLDDRELRANLERARAELLIAQNNVKYSEAELKARQAAYRRAQEMRELGLNSDADLEEAEFRAKGAGFDLESWRATVDRTQAEIRMLEINLEKTSIRAPFAGVVARRYIRQGQNVLKDDKCFRLSQLSPLQVRFLVAETAARHPQPGDAVQVVPVSDSQRVYRARVAKVSPTVDAASGSFEVTAQLTDDIHELRPGMSVRVLWPVGSANSKN